jgi:hypothetical protein
VTQKGIDGVYKSRLDDLIPYQVKFRTNRPRLSFTEVALFLGATEKSRDRDIFTNTNPIAIDARNRSGVRLIRGIDFDGLEKAGLDATFGRFGVLACTAEIVNNCE